MDHAITWLSISPRLKSLSRIGLGLLAAAATFFAHTAPAVAQVYGDVTYIGTLGGSDSTAHAVSGGQVVGISWTSGDVNVHAFSWTNSTGLLDLGTLGGTGVLDQ